MDQLSQVPKYVTIVKNGRRYRAREGRKAHKTYLESLPKTETLPWGWRRRRDGRVFKTKQRLAAERESKELRFPNFETEQTVRLSREERVNRFETRALLSELPSIEIEETPLRLTREQRVESFINQEVEKIMRIAPKIQQGRRDENMMKYIRNFEFVLHPFKKTTIPETNYLPESLIRAGIRLVQQQGQNVHSTFSILYVHEEDNRRYATFKVENVKHKTEDELVKELKTFLENYPYDLFPVNIALIVIRPPAEGGCEEKCETYHSVTDFLPQTRLWLASPKSKHDNCGIMCFLRFLNIPGNKVKPVTIREKYRLGKGPIHYKDMAKLAAHFEVNMKLYVHPLANENDVKETYHHGDSSLTIHIHLKAGHYLFEHKDRTSNYACIECGAGTSTDLKTGKKKFRRGSAGQTKCDVCNPVTRNYYKRMVIGQNLVTIPSSKKQEPPNLKKIVFFDVETYPDENNIATPYAVGFMVPGQSTQVYYGPDCFDRFMSWAYQQKDMTFIAYNGARFDHHLLVEHIIASKTQFDKNSLILSNGRVISFEFGQGNKVWDLCLFTMCSLDEMGKSFQCDVLKSHFDHDRVKCLDDAMRLQHEVEPYLVNDVETLGDGFYKFASMVYEIDGVNVLNFYTLSQMAYYLWRRTLAHQEKHDIQIRYTREQYIMIKKARYGGRVYPLVKEYESKIKDLDRRKIRESGDYLLAADVVSLYPAAMRGTRFMKVAYPIGPHRWSDNPKADFEKGLCGIFDVHVTPRANLVEPILPHHPPKKGGLDWPLYPFRDNFTNVDLVTAKENGYKVDFVGKAIVWDDSTDQLFNQYVDRWFEMKKQAKKDGNKVKYQIAKIMQNGLYGKLQQKPIDTKDFWTDNSKEACEFLATHNLVDAHFLDKADMWIIKGKLPDIDIAAAVTKPMHLGAFVLSYSRRIMIHYARLIDPTLTRPIKVYGDTDSMFITGTDHQRLEKIGGVFGTELGMLDNDMKDDALITRWCCHQPKTYHALAVNNKNQLISKMGCKGIPTKVPAKAGDSIPSTTYPGEDPEHKKAKGGEKVPILHHEDFVRGESKLIFFKTYEKNHVKSSSPYDPFTIRIYDTKRTFLSTKWTGFDFDGKNRWYPKGYDPHWKQDESTSKETAPVH